MQDSLRDIQIRQDRHMATDPIGTRPTIRLNARVAGDISLFDDEDSTNSSAERLVIWRWQVRRRRR
ncbi:MAG: hypothetical protein HGA65_03615 [Oscillochloris sp.]|nr:hypothetical protein [Oscillochloris sp.]